MILRSVLARAEMQELVPYLLEHHAEHRDKGQSGCPLSYACVHVAPLVEPLGDIADYIFGEPAYFDDGQSCFRVQPPTGEGQLSPHQDIAALRIGTMADRGLTFWVPLTDITDKTPTIARGPRTGKIEYHCTDENGYSIMPTCSYVLEPLFDLKIGDAVVLWPDTVHATYIPPGATETRMSLDLRAFPVSRER